MRPRRYLSAAATLALALAIACDTSSTRGADGQPVGLVVLISVDQLPAYLFERYDSIYTGGFRRLLENGRSYRQAVYEHAGTWTSSGHATLSTGMHPSRHGIVANGWTERRNGEWRQVESVHDEDESILGLPGKTGRSPRNLLVTGLADWILEADRQSRVVSMTGKPTASVLMAGRAPGHVYWYEDDIGRFVTSSYYRDRYPDWVERFNDNTLPAFYADSVWRLSVPAELRPLARRDRVEYEGDGVHTTFPHVFSQEVSNPDNAKDFYNWWDHTPALDVATLALAREAVTALSLGRRGSIDYLAVGLSQTDRVGHAYGPYSLEQLDALLRADRLLGEFFEFLDREVGAGRYVVALSSDHGAPAIPDWLREQGQPGKRITRAERRALRDSIQQLMASSGSVKASRSALAELLRRVDYIADVMTVEELESGEPRDSFVALYQRMYRPERLPGGFARYGLVVRYEPGTNWSGDRTTHGSVYLYDRHVPVIFWGPGVAPGRVDAPARAVDVAPTLAELVGIPYPNDLDGRPLIAR